MENIYMYNYSSDIFFGAGLVQFDSYYQWLRPDLTEKYLTGTLNLNTNKNNVITLQEMAIHNIYIHILAFLFYFQNL